MKRYRTGRTADSDLAAIADYYAERSVPAGRRQERALTARFRLLARLPGMGRPRVDLGPGIRSSVVHPHVVFYRSTGDEVLILRVMHGSRDIGPEDFVELDED